MSITTICENTEIERPSHYMLPRGIEVIHIIEALIADAPSNQAAFLHGQVIKYICRCWKKNAAAKDLRKARWYLDRLIDLLDDNPDSVRKDGH